MPLALNIALRLPPDWEAEARRLNGLLSEQPNPVPLATSEALPHITLAMGVIDDASVLTLQDRLRHELADDWRVTLEPGITYLKQELGELDVSGVSIHPNATLHTLHERIFQMMLDTGWLRPTLGAIRGTANVDPRTLDLMQHFKEKGTFQHYSPHITLGMGTLPAGEVFQAPPTIFDQLGVYMMGNLCTCRQELFHIDLADNHDIAGGGFRGGWRMGG